MAVTPKPRKRADGGVRWRVQFRLRPGGAPTAEHFDSFEDAEQFISLAGDVGWEAAQRVRDGMSARDERIPTLKTWFETHLEIKVASVTPGTIDEYRREAERTWMPRLGHLPLDMITPESVTSWIAWQRQQETARSAKRRAKAIEEGETPPDARTGASQNHQQRATTSILGAEHRIRALHHHQRGERRQGAQRRGER